MPANIPIPPVFLERMSQLLGEEFPAFEAALTSPPVSGLRVNTLKISPDDFRIRSPFVLGDPVPWAPSAFFLNPQQSQPGLHPFHQAGLYYLQDPSAMAPAALLAPQPGERVLDLAAAPGGKATALAALMHGEGLLVVNEIKDKRLGHLAMNMERWAAPNVVITNETPERLADGLGPFFDQVLVDAPCSGEGMFRKDMGARMDWSPKMVAGCAQRQVNILGVAAKLVCEGGMLLYSTCTFNPEENEEVILNLLGEFPEYRVFPLPQFPGFMPGQPGWISNLECDQDRKASLVGAVRLFPHRVMGEGHFICCLQRGFVDGESRVHRFLNRGRELSLQEMDIKQGDLWNEFSAQVLNHRFEDDRLRIRGERLYYTPRDMPQWGSLRVVHPGIWLGTFKKDRFEPAHPLALFLDKSKVNKMIDLPGGDPRLQSYLQGGIIQDPGEPGWVLVCVDGYGLGWGKRVQGGVKNHYPRGWLQY
jgi:NOL1/NOP2/sun family putative RNA methylase